MPKVREKKMRNTNRPTVKEYVKQRIKDIPLTVIMCAYVAFCLASIVYFICIGQYRDIPIAIGFMACAFVFYFAEYTLNARVPYGYAVFMLLFLLFCFLGASYNFYGLIPCLDDILHAAWGIVFGIIGIIIIKALIGAPRTAKGVIACVLFGLGFAMLLSIVWEIYEFTGDSIIRSMDMQQDTIVDHIHSFVMFPDPANPAPDNLHTWQVEGIAKTVLYDAEGNIIGIIPNGYLDLGLYDTMYDLIFCFSTSVVFSVVLAIDWCKGKYLYRFLIPALVGEKYDKHGNMIEDGATAAETTEAAVPVAEEEEVTQEN